MGIVNISKEQNIAKSVSDNVERVKNNDLEVWYATKTLGFNEGSIDKPNFYCPSDVNADKTKETIIDEQILNWEDNIIGLFGIDSKLIKSAYIGDNDKLVITLKTNVLTNISNDINVFNLEYLKIKIVSTGEIKYFFVKDFKTNESRTSSITILALQDYWLTYYKELVLNAKGDFKVMRKHFDRYIENTNNIGDRKYYGNFSKSSNVWNLDGQFTNFTTDNVRSLGVKVKQENQGGIDNSADITVDNPEILMNCYIKKTGSTYWSQDYGSKQGYGKTLYFSEYQRLWNFDFRNGTGDVTQSLALSSPAVWSAYDSAGNLTTKKEFSTYRDSTYINNLNYIKGCGVSNTNIVNSSGNVVFTDVANDTTPLKAYGPKVVPANAVSLVEPKFAYLKKNEVKAAAPTSPYSIVLSASNIEGEADFAKNHINRIEVPKNNLISEKGVEVKPDPNAVYRYAVLGTTELVDNEITGDLIYKKYGDVIYVITSDKFNLGVPNEMMVNNDLALYLVDYNSAIRDEAGNIFDYGIKVKIPTSTISVLNSSTCSVQVLNSATGYIKLSMIKMPPSILISFNSGDFKNSNTLNSPKIEVSFNTTMFYISYGYGLGTYINQRTFDELPLTSSVGGSKVEYPIDLFNKNSIMNTEFVKEIKRDEYDLFENATTRALQYKYINYVPNDNWNWFREPQLRLGHCIKTYLSYLGVKKQLFLELGDLGNIKFNQNILVNTSMDKIYFTNSSVYDGNNLQQLNGFLTKTYDNTLPSLTDTFDAFISANGASLQANYFSATENLNFTKQQSSINNAQTSLNAKKANANSLFGIAGSVIAGAAATAGLAAMTGGASLIGTGIGLATAGTGLGKSGMGMNNTQQQNKLNAQQNQLSNAQTEFNALQSVRSIQAGVLDKYNQPDQLQSGSVEAYGVKREREEVKGLFQDNRVDFFIETQAPTLSVLEEYSFHVNQYGYISNNVFFDKDFDFFLERQRFNYVQLEDIGHKINTNIPAKARAYFDNVFNTGVRLWNVSNDISINDYSKENWENTLVKKGVKCGEDLQEEKLEEQEI